MTIWLAISNHKNWEIIKKENIWGVTKHHKNTIEKVMVNDKIIIYVSQVNKSPRVFSQITGVYDVISPMYEDSTDLFIPKDHGRDRSFPYRIKLKPCMIFKEPILFETLINRLNFIVNKKNWGGHLQGKAMRIIPTEDYELIISIQS